MKRWFIARMGEYIEPGDIVPKVAMYLPNGQPRTSPDQASVSYRQWSVDGFAWCFGQLAASSMTNLQADPDIYILPDGALDMTVASIPSQTRQTMRNRLEAAGFTFAGVTNQWSIRQVLAYLRSQIQPALGDNVEDGDVRDFEG